MPQAIHSVSKEEVMAHVDGQLETGRAVEVAQHLETCEECQQQRSEFEGLSRCLASWEIESSSFEAPSVPAERTAPKIPFWKRPWLMAGSAAVVLVIAGLTQTHQSKMVTRKSAATDIVAEIAAPQAFMRRAGEQAGQEHAVPLIESQAAPFRTPVPASLPARAPLIVRTAQLSLVSKNFERIRAEVDRICKAHQGYVGLLQLSTTPVHGTAGQSRSLNATLHIASTQLDTALDELRKLGQMTGESQGGEDVTQRSVDLDARLANLRTTEQRLQQILKSSTGKLSDVLEVEEAVDRTRGEIETAEAEQKMLASQIEFATVQLSVSEEYKEQIGSTPDSVLTRLHNAAVDGYRNGVETVVGGLALVLSIGPTLLIFLAVGAYPAFLIWRKAFRRGQS